MKILCDSCEKAAATILCCADEAALCCDCDGRVHAANKLAGKHRRISLLDNKPSDNNTFLPCDICQEKSALFFCLEDRAILCRNCDVSIHSTNALTAKHCRFLMTGIRVGLHEEDGGGVSIDDTITTKPGIVQENSPSMSSLNPQPSLKTEHHCDYYPSTPRTLITPPAKLDSNVSSSALMPSLNERMEGGLGLAFSNQNEISGEGSIPEWRVDDLLGLTDMLTGGGVYSHEDLEIFRGPLFNYAQASKVVPSSNNFGGIEWLSEMDCFQTTTTSSGDSFGQVPQILSPQLFSGVSKSGIAPVSTKGKITPHSFHMPRRFEDTLVPDVGIHSSPNLSPTYLPIKRRRA